MKTILCPKCFTKSPVADLPYGCANSDCSREAVPTTVEGRDTQCSACQQPMTMRFCPDCGFQLSVGKDSAESLPLSIVGTQGSGKSHYLSVLINEIRHSVGKAYNCSLYPLGGDDTILQYEKYYYDPLFLEKETLQSTVQDMIRPLMYSLVFNEEASGKTCNLTFYDACGENFSNERIMANYNRSVFNSRGILFLVDPSQLPGLREEFQQRGLPVSEEDFSAQLGRTIQLIRQGRGLDNLNNKIDIPIAICVTKMDLVRQRLDASSFLRYPSRHLQQDAYELVDHNACHMEMEALLNNWQANELINQVKSQFEHTAFFGISALGNAPATDGTVSHVTPFRVSDPFLWLLAKNEIIRTVWN